MTTQKIEIDLDRRPPSHWRQPEAIFANIKGTMRKSLGRALVSGECVDCPSFLLSDSVPLEYLRTAVRDGTQLLGGEFLPDYETGELEIARIVRGVATHDVVSVRVRPTPGSDGFIYRVVGERGERFVLGAPDRREELLSLRELVELIDTTAVVGRPTGLVEPLWDLLGGQVSPTAAAGLVLVTSAFYPQLSGIYAARPCPPCVHDHCDGPDRLPTADGGETGDFGRFHSDPRVPESCFHGRTGNIKHADPRKMVQISSVADSRALRTGESPATLSGRHRLSSRCVSLQTGNLVVALSGRPPRAFHRRPHMSRLLAGVVSLTVGISLSMAQTPPLATSTDLRAAVEGTLVLMVERPTGPLQTGTAFSIADGLVATCYHVVAGGTSATVRLPHSTELFICREVVAYDELHDLAILRVPSLRAQPLRLGDARSVDRGQRVFALGNPDGFEGTLTEGIITRINTYPETGRFDFLISAQIHHGSSGGPIVDSTGAVIGIAQRGTAADEDGSVLYNFAQPSSYLADLLATREAYTPVRLDQLPLRTPEGAMISKHTYSAELGKEALGVFDRGSQLQIRRAAPDWYALPSGLYWCFRNMRTYSETFSQCFRYRTEMRALPEGNWERVTGWKYRNTKGGTAWRLSRFCDYRGYFDREVFSAQSRWDDAWKDVPPLFESKGVQPYQWDFLYFNTTGTIDWQTGEVFATRVWSEDIVEVQGFSLVGGKFEGLVKLSNSRVLKDGELVGEFFLVRDSFTVPPEFKVSFEDGQRDDDDPRVDVWRRSDPRWRYVPAAEFRVDAAELAWAIEEGLAELVEWEFEGSVIQEGIWTRRVVPLKRQPIRLGE